MQRSMAVERIPLWILLMCAACKDTSPAADETTGGSSSGGSSAGTSTTMGSSSGSTTDATSSGTSAADSSGSSDGSSTTGGEIELAGECPLDVHVGGFLAGYEKTYSAFSGSVADGVVPVSVLEQVAEEGDCKLLLRNNPFCDPGCLAGDVCDFDGNCIPYPLNHDLGVVTATGLADPIMLEPVPPTYSYFYTMLPNPGFEPGAILTVESEGGDYSPISLQGIGVTMVEPGVEEIHVAHDTPLDITWTPGDPRTSMRLQVGIDQHGTSPLSLICTAPADAGTLTVSGDLINQFLDNGVSGFPSADFYFETVDSVVIEPGCVDFVVRSHAQVVVFVEGHTPCNVTPDCPDGQTCDVMTQTCV